MKNWFFPFLALFVMAANPALAGRMLLSNLDADFHAGFDPCAFCFDPAASRAFLRTSIEWVRAGSTKPFLFVESSIIPPFRNYLNDDPAQGIDGSGAFHTRGVTGIVKSGYVEGVDFEKRDASTLADALTKLHLYSAIVVASDFGGVLTADELRVLNSFRGSIRDFLSAGGGLFAMAQTNDGIGRFDPSTGLADPSLFDAHGYLLPGMGLLGSEQRWGFVPLPIESDSSYGQVDTDQVLTSFGASLGFEPWMVEGNVSHLYFRPSPYWQVVSYSSSGKIANVAALWVPEPATLGLCAAALSVLAFRRYQRRTAA